MVGIKLKVTGDSSLFKWLLLIVLLGVVGPSGQGEVTQETVEGQLEAEIQTTLEREHSKAGTNGSDPERSQRSRRSVVHLYDMVVCATGCNPLAYKGYGCYCGFLGSGLSVDGIDSCCQQHDWCYNQVQCPPLLTYFVPYYWTCADGRPHCVGDYRGWKGICGTHLCECDRQFAECLRKYPCPRSRAMCMTSPWRFWQNLVMQPPLHAFDYYDYYR